jgi:hypothetical protein
MSNSETSSSEVRINYQDSKGTNLLEDKKPQSTDTDFYFNMIANPTKIVLKESDTESSDFNNMMKKTESDSSNSSESSRKRSSESRTKVESIRVTQSEKKSEVSPRPTIPSLPRHVENNESLDMPKVLTAQEIRMKKIELLRKLSEIKTKGYKLTKEYDFNSSLEEMEYEYDLLKSFADKRNGVKIFRNGLLQAVSVIEFLNDKYDPFDFHLSGWGEHMSVEIDSWEDVLEELYEKYKGSGKKMAPEIKLVYLIIASASAFHFTKSQASKIPGLDSMLASNPGLLSKIINPSNKETSQFVSPQELNIQQQKEELKKRDEELKMKQQMQMQQMQKQQIQKQQIQKQQMQNNNPSQNQNNKFDTSSSIENILKSQIFNEPVAANAKPLPKTISVDQLKVERPNIIAPDQVKDILSRIHNIQSTIKSPKARSFAGNTETQDETSSQNDRLVSETTLSENNPRKRMAKKKKSGIVIE